MVILVPDDLMFKFFYRYPLLHHINISIGSDEKYVADVSFDRKDTTLTQMKV